MAHPGADRGYGERSGDTKLSLNCLGCKVLGGGLGAPREGRWRVTAGQMWDTAGMGTSVSRERMGSWKRGRGRGSDFAADVLSP